MIEIELTQGYVTVIDDCDFDLSKLSWCAHVTKNKVYAKRGITIDGKSRALFLHQVIMVRMIGRELEKKECPDHSDRNGLNNCRSNLVLSNYAENAWNTSPKRGRPFKGVYKTTSGTFYYQIMTFGKRETSYRFKTEIEAYEARLIRIKELHGSFASME